MHAHPHAHASPSAAGAAGTHADARALRRSGQRRLLAMLALSASYMVAEAIGGWITGSLALLADAGHMLSDVGSLSLAAFAMWMAQRPADARRTFGHTRAEILAALAQAAALFAVAALIVLEAFERLGAPPPVAGAGMALVATGGLAVNLVGLYVLGHVREHNLSLRGAWLHVLSDALGSVGAVVAGLAIWLRGWYWADPLASLLICALVLWGAWFLLRDAVDILMETAPRHLDVDEIRAALCALDDVAEVHDLHVWTIGSGEVSLSCHVVTRAGSDPAAVLCACNGLLEADFGIAHATIQIEPASGPAGAVADVGCTSACEPGSA